MVNPRFLRKAEKWMNQELPVEKVRQEPEPEQIPSSERNGNVQYSFLGEDFGRDALGEYEERVKSQYDGISALSGIFSFSDNVVKGSNPFALILLNRTLKGKGVCVATPADLERVIKANTLNLQGTYNDIGLVLRSEGEPNEYLAGNLAGQIRGRNVNVEYPAMIPLAGLDLEKDSNSLHGLIFKLTDESEIIYAPQLSHENNNKKFNETYGTGMPIFDENGTRTLYTGDGGLRVLFRDRGLDLDARVDGLSGSYVGGRVIICAEGTR